MFAKAALRFVSVFGFLALATACGSGGASTSSNLGGSGGEGGASSSPSSPSSTSTSSANATSTSSGSGAGAGSSTSTGGAGGSEPTSGIRILVEPDGQSGKQLVDAITAAKTSVHMTMYILSDDDTVNALVAQAKAGREVQVVLNKNLPSGSNAAVYSTLQNGGVAVHWSSSKFTYTHEKCVILDGREAWIMTMNADYSAPRDNREYLAIDDQAADVAEAEAVFAGDFAGSPPTSVSGSLLVAPINAHAQLTALAASARTSIDIEAEELSDDKIVSALTTAAKSGVTVRVVLSDVARDSTEAKALTTLKAGGVHVVQLSTPYVHAKSMVVDGTTAYVGSENFTYDSLEDNRELGLIFAIPTEVSKIVTTTAQDFAAGTPL